MDNLNNAEMNLNNTEVDNKEEEIVIPPPEIHINMTKDKMLVYLKINVFNEEQIVTPKEVLDLLASMKITYGIDTNIIQDYCTSKRYYKEIKIASGLRAHNGEDGSIELFFKEKLSNMPIKREDGTVDYKNLDIIQNVDKDALLAKLTLAKEGVDGINVLGEKIPAKPGKNPSLPVGVNTYITENGSELKAKVDGSIKYEHNKVNIDENYIINTNVGLETGNINVNGNVIIHGNVLEGFNVTSRKSITVKGLVEGAYLNAGENILISNGFNGMGKGKLIAIGDVTAKFIENGNVYCGGSVITDVALSSFIKAGKNIILRGKRSSLIAGKYQAGNMILAQNIGTSNNNHIELILLENWYEEEQEEQQGKNSEEASTGLTLDKELLLNEKSKCIQILDSITDQIEQLNKFTNTTETVAQKTVNIRKLIIQKSDWVSKLNKINDLLETLEKDNKETSEAKIICKGTMFLGTKIQINMKSFKLVKDIVNQKFYINNGEIEAGQILPSEVDLKN